MWKRAASVVAVILGVTGLVSVAFAIPPLTPYNANETLDPSCAPSDANCYVEILPDQTGNAGEFLTTDGTSLSWAAVTATASGGAGQIQFYNGGALGADSNLYWDNTNKRLGIATSTPGTTLSVGGNAVIGGNLTATGTLSVSGLTSLTAVAVTGASALQTMSFTNATGTAATTTNLFATTASSTNLFATNLNAALATLGNATSTNFFSTTASSTNLYSTNLTAALGIFGRSTTTAATTTNFYSSKTTTDSLVINGEVVTDLTGTGLEVISGALSVNSGAAYSTTSSDYWLTTKTTANLSESGNLYFTNARADARINATSSIGTLTDAPNLTTIGTLTNLALSGSSTLQNFTFVRATGTAATTTNFYATTASTSHIFATNASTSVFSAAAICLTADSCRTTWPTSGSGGSGTGWASSSGDSASIIFTGSNFVGIGTSTPWARLSVEGTSTLGNVAIAGYFTGTSSATSTLGGGLSIGSSTPNGASFVSVGTSSPLLTVNKSGNIGIGTAAPAQKLTVTGGSILLDTAQGVWWGDNNTRIFGNSTAISLVAGGDVRLMVSDNGHVGIGTSSPYSMLSVAGQVVGQNFVATGSTASAFQTVTFTNATGTSIFNTTASSTNLFSTNANIASLTSGSLTLAAMNGLLAATNGVVAATSTPTASVFNATSTTVASQFPYASTTALTATAICLTGDSCRTTWPTGGGSGGGTWATTTSTVSGRLVNYPNNNTDIIAIGNNSTTSAKYWFDPNTLTAYLGGNVGIGTSSPIYAFSVEGTSTLGNAAIAGYFLGTSTATSTFGGTVSVGSTTPDGTTLFSVGTTSPLLNVNKNNGFVGIGTTTANSKLAVVYNGSDATGLTAFLVDASQSSISNSAAFSVRVPSTGTQKAFQISKGTDLAAWASFEYNVGGTGKPGLALGAGGGSARDASIYRNSAGVLRTDADFIADGLIAIGTTSPIAALSVGVHNESSNYLVYVASSSTGVATSSPFVVTGAGNVGIGTTSPYSMLSVAGQIVAQNIITTSTSATSSTAGTFSVGSSTPNGGSLFAVGTSSQLLFVSKTNGRVAIGSTDPQATLDINGSLYMRAGGVIRMEQTNGASALTVVGMSASAVQIGDTTGVGFPVQLMANGSEGLRVSTAGNVGIGTTSPWAKLSVEGGTSTLGSNAIAGYFTATSSVASALQALTFTNATGTNIYSTTASSTNLFTTNFVAALATMGNATSTNFYSTTASSTNLYATNASTSVFSAAAICLTGDACRTTWPTSGSGGGGVGWASSSGDSTSIYFTGSGNVGVGTTSTYAKFAIGPHDGGTANLFVVASSSTGVSTSTALIVTAAGQVGIGTANPASVSTLYPLVIRKANAAGIGFDDEAGSVAEILNRNGFFQINSPSGPLSMSSGDSIRFYSAASAEFARINTVTGFFGLGTTSPWAKLSVEGTSTLGNVAIAGYFNATNTATASWFGYASTTALSATAICLTGDTCRTTWPTGGSGSGGVGWASSSGDSASIYFTGSNFVGIGTTSPYAKLSVSGLILGDSFFATSTTATSTFMGSFSIGSTTPASSAIFSIGTSSQLLFVNKNSGYVGIGTTTPFAPLAVQGEVFAEKYTTYSTTSTSTLSGGLNVNDGALTVNHSTGITNIAAAQIGAMNFEDDAGVVSWANLPVISAASGLIQSYSASIDDVPVLTIYGSSSGSGVVGDLAVGIGTTSPYSMLSVAGQVVAANYIGTSTATSSLGGSFSIGSSTPASSALFSVGTSSQLLYVNKNSGNVGVGTTTPFAMFAVNGDAAASAFTAYSSSATSTFAGSFSIGSSTPNSSALFSIGTSSQLLFVNKNSGNVGVGTTSPYAKLSVQGEVFAEVFTGYSTTSTSTLPGGLNVGSGALTYNHTTGITAIAAAQFGSLNFDDDAGAVNWINLPVVSAASGLIQSYSANIDDIPVLTIFGSSSGSGVVGDLAVGIGTTSPYSMLSVAGQVVSRNYVATSTTATSTIAGSFSIGSSTPTGSALFSIGTSSQLLYVNKNSGNVGVGTTTPSSIFAVTGTVSFANLTGSTGAGSLCLSSNNEVVYNSASDACLPSLQETKHDITALSSNALLDINALRPVSFVYNEGDGRTRYGFIAEETAEVDDNLATHNAEGALSGIDDRALLALSIQGIQDISKLIGATSSDMATTSVFTRIGTLEASVKTLEEFVTNFANSTLSLSEIITQRLTAEIAEFKKVKAETVGVSKGFEMVDQGSGEVWCVTIKNGDWDKKLGSCDSQTVEEDDEEEEEEDDDTPPVDNATTTDSGTVATSTDSGTQATSTNSNTDSTENDEVEEENTTEEEPAPEPTEEEETTESTPEESSNEEGGSTESTDSSNSASNESSDSSDSSSDSSDSSSDSSGDSSSGDNGSES